MAKTTNDRGFFGYGIVECTRGTKISVYESSAATGPHVWMALENPGTGPGLESFKGRVVSHLTLEQAKQVIAMLQGFVDDVPTRWDLTEG
jgi:hypothetical protein